MVSERIPDAMLNGTVNVTKWRRSRRSDLAKFRVSSAAEIACKQENL
jgi:hypothetical protein